MKDLEEQRVCVKFCFKLGKTFTETFQMLQQASGEDCLSRTQCHEWYQRFKSGRTSVEDDPKSGRSSTSMDDDHVEKVLAVIRQNRRPTVREVAEGVGICKSSCHLILTDKLRFSGRVYGADGAVRRTAPSAPYTRLTQRLSRPPPIQKLCAENHMLQRNI